MLTVLSQVNLGTNSHGKSWHFQTNVALGTKTILFSILLNAFRNAVVCLAQLKYSNTNFRNIVSNSLTSAVSPLSGIAFSKSRLWRLCDSRVVALRRELPSSVPPIAKYTPTHPYFVNITQSLSLYMSKRKSTVPWSQSGLALKRD